jgi:hypothetical protein
VARIETLRRQRWTGTQIAREAGVSKATVFRVLGRLGLNRLKALEPAEPVRRYEREHPGELIHIDIKKLGRFNRTGHRITGDRVERSRGPGWEFVHVCIGGDCRHNRRHKSTALPDDLILRKQRFLLGFRQYLPILLGTVREAQVFHIASSDVASSSKEL